MPNWRLTISPLMPAVRVPPALGLALALAAEAGAAAAEFEALDGLAAAAVPVDAALEGEPPDGGAALGLAVAPALPPQAASNMPQAPTKPERKALRRLITAPSS